MLSASQGFPNDNKVRPFVALRMTTSESEAPAEPVLHLALTPSPSPKRRGECPFSLWEKGMGEEGFLPRCNGALKCATTSTKASSTNSPDCSKARECFSRTNNGDFENNPEALWANGKQGPNTLLETG